MATCGHPVTQPILSIIVPTYRRPVELHFQLASILCQLDDVPIGSVEVIVVDNGLDEMTPRVMHDLQRNGSALKYVQRDSSVALEISIMSAREHGTGQYLWTLPDDDAIHPGCVKAILQHIQSESPEIFLISIEAWDPDLANCIGIGHSFLKERATPFPSLHEAVRVLGWGVYFAYIGAAVFRADPFRSADISPYAGSAHIYSFALLEAFWNKPCEFVRFPAIKYRVDRALPWSGDKLHGVTTAFAECFQAAIGRGLGDWKTFLGFRECIATDHKLLYLKVHSLAACMLSNIFDRLKTDSRTKITETEWRLFEVAYAGYGNGEMLRALALMRSGQVNLLEYDVTINRALAAILIRENQSKLEYPPDFALKASPIGVTENST